MTYLELKTAKDKIYSQVDKSDRYYKQRLVMNLFWFYKKNGLNSVAKFSMLWDEVNEKFFENKKLVDIDSNADMRKQALINPNFNPLRSRK